MINKFEKYDIFTIFFLKENKMKLWYPGVEAKGKRPFILIQKTAKEAVLVPCTTIKNNESSTNISNSNWFEIKLKDKENPEKLIDNYIASDRYLTRTWNEIEECIKRKIIDIADYNAKAIDNNEQSLLKCKNFLKDIFIDKNKYLDYSGLNRKVYNKGLVFHLYERASFLMAMILLRSSTKPLHEHTKGLTFFHFDDGTDENPFEYIIGDSIINNEFHITQNKQTKLIYFLKRTSKDVGVYDLEETRKFENDQKFLSDRVWFVVEERCFKEIIIKKTQGSNYIHFDEIVGFKNFKYLYNLLKLEHRNNDLPKQIKDLIKKPLNEYSVMSIVENLRNFIELLSKKMIEIKFKECFEYTLDILEPITKISFNTLYASGPIWELRKQNTHLSFWYEIGKDLLLKAIDMNLLTIDVKDNLDMYLKEIFG